MGSDCVTSCAASPAVHGGKGWLERHSHVIMPLLPTTKAAYSRACRKRYSSRLYGLRNYRKKLDEALKQDADDGKKTQQCN